MSTGTIDLGALRKQAEEAYRSHMRDTVQWLSTNCWPHNIGHQFSRMNEFIEAARQFGVCQAQTFTETEIEALAVQIAPLRTLEVAADIIRQFVTTELAKKGVDPSIFDEKK